MRVAQVWRTWIYKTVEQNSPESTISSAEVPLYKNQEFSCRNYFFSTKTHLKAYHSPEGSVSGPCREANGRAPAELPGPHLHIETCTVTKVVPKNMVNSVLLLVQQLTVFRGQKSKYTPGFSFFSVAKPSVKMNENFPL